MDFHLFEKRKREHIQQALSPAHEAFNQSGLEKIHLFHEALPDLNFEDVKLSSICLGKPAYTPFYVAGMTAGYPDAFKINCLLAHFCQKRGWALGIGSQRRDLESLDEISLNQWRLFREEVPHLALFANIGISQLMTTPLTKLMKLVQAIQAQALAVHANALQEVLQPEGTPQFKNCLATLRKVCDELGIPVILKETGCGFSAATLERLQDFRLAAIDVSGLGGTHWGRVEGARAGQATLQATASRTFANWGESTVESVLAVRKVLPRLEVWASGGVRSGLDAAKLTALGACQIGYAKPALQAVLEGPEALDSWMQLQEFELKIALFCTGTATPNALREKERAWKQNVT